MKYEIKLSKELQGTSYGCFHGMRISLPQNRELWPSNEALEERIKRQLNVMPLEKSELF